MRAVWLNGSLVHPGAAAVSIDSPLTRWGDGLFETMRAENARIRFMDEHLDRIGASARLLGIRIATRAELISALDAACVAGGAEHQRVRLTIADDLLLVAVDDTDPLGSPDVAEAAVVPGAWNSGWEMAEHKSSSYSSFRRAARHAAKSGAEVAVLADERGYFGEADIGNVMAAINGQLITPSVRGLLPGIARGALVATGMAREGDLAPEVVATATELIVTNAVRGVIALRSTSGEPWSHDTPGPLATAAQEAFAKLG